MSTKPLEPPMTRWLYERAPVWVQNAMASVYGLTKIRARYGPQQQRWKTFFQASEGWAEADLLAYRRQQLRRTIHHAYEHVPFYRRWFREAGVRPDDIRDVDDLPRLPLLDKPTVARAGDEMLADGVDRSSLLIRQSSGSSGMPVTLYTPPETLHMVYGFMWARLRKGYSLRTPFASFTGLELVRPEVREPPFWRDNWARGQRAFSVFHLNDATMPHYVRALEEHRPRFIEGYCAPVFHIAEWIEREGVRLGWTPEAVFSTSEVLQPRYRETIERVLHTRVYDQYGQGEFCCSATEYDCGHMHEDLDYGVMELVEVGREDGLVRAEIVGTSLHNLAWPLIRWRVGDLCLYDPDERCEAGHPGRIIRRIEGRTGHAFTLDDGTVVTNVSVIAKRCRNLRYLQVIQHAPGDLEVRVVPDAGYRPREDGERVIEQFRRKIGDHARLTLTVAEAPLLTTMGKFLSIIDEARGVELVETER